MAADTGRTPSAHISAGALAHNISVALSAVPTGAEATADLRADAWGHGAATVATALRAAGVRLVGGDAESTGNATPLDNATLLGLPGGSPGTVPVMRLVGTVLSTKDLRAGEGVSYGFTHRAHDDTRVALVTGGYAQGVVRSLGDRVELAIAGSPHPIVGRVAMDVCVVDIADHAVARGSTAVFFGDPAEGHPALAPWCAATGLTAAEIVTAVGAHTRREVIA